MDDLIWYIDKLGVYEYKALTEKEEYERNVYLVLAKNMRKEIDIILNLQENVNT